MGIRKDPQSSQDKQKLHAVTRCVSCSRRWQTGGRAEICMHKDTRRTCKLFFFSSYYLCESWFLDAVHIRVGFRVYLVVYCLVADCAVHQRLWRRGKTVRTPLTFKTLEDVSTLGLLLTLSFLKGQLWGLESADPLAHLVGFRKKWW